MIIFFSIFNKQKIQQEEVVKQIIIIGIFQNYAVFKHSSCRFELDFYVHFDAKNSDFTQSY